MYGSLATLFASFIDLLRPDFGDEERKTRAFLDVTVNAWSTFLVLFDMMDLGFRT